MACPLFLPSSPLAGFSDLYGGACAVDNGAPIPVDTLRHYCNAGYARGFCERAAKSDADAFRFAIKANRGGAVDVAWSSERDHHPVAVGMLTVNGTAVADASPLERQARVCVDAYLRQIGA
jgi:hypothetical protein